LSQEIKTIATHSDIELTEEEISDAIEYAKQKKIDALKQAEIAKYNQHVENEIRRDWNHEDLKAFVIARAQDRGMAFVVDEPISLLFEALCYYFTGDKHFESMTPEGRRPWNLNKGLLLCGGVGTGKTTLLKVFNLNKRRAFKIVSCKHIAAKYADVGNDAITEHSGHWHVPTSRDYFYQNKIGICFDDLGDEDSRKNFGNQANVMADIIQNRYDSGVPYHFTHITTNLTMDEIESFYGTRVRSRIREMFNIIQLDGEDRRK